MERHAPITNQSFLRRERDQAAAKQAELEAEQSSRALKTQLKTDLASRLARAGMVKMGAVTVDAGTQNNIVAVLCAIAKLPKAAVRALDDIFDLLEKRATEIAKARGLSMMCRPTSLE
jgi:non-ribosomal peptide synthetase component E (peptide arylation enzyme)